MKNLEQLFDGEQLISDDMFLRSNRRGLSIHKQSINIGDTQYQVSTYKPFLALTFRIKVDVLIYVASLSAYYQASKFSDVRKGTCAERLKYID